MQLSFEEYRSKYIEQQRYNNIDDFISKIIKNEISEEMKTKINNRFIKYKKVFEKSGIKTVDEFIKKISDNPLLALGLEKEPIRQNFDENIQIEYQKKKHNVEIKKLPTVGKSSKCFDIRDMNNIMISSSQKMSFKNGERTKTFDGYIEKTKTYVFMKYVNESGGSQDNQISDLKQLTQIAKLFLKQNKDTEYNFLVLIDGKYINKYIDSFEQNDKIIVRNSN